MSPVRERRLTRFAILATFAACAVAGSDLFNVLVEHFETGSPFPVIKQITFILIAGGLIYGSLVYQFARLGHLRRQIQHRPIRRKDLLDWTFERDSEPVAFLVPSYKEEARVIRQSLLSSALQEYPNRRVILLIDDPPNPTDPEDQAQLEATRLIPPELHRELARQAIRFRQAEESYSARSATSPVAISRECRILARLYTAAGEWFKTQATRYETGDHTDRLFAEKVPAHISGGLAVDRDLVTGKARDPRDSRFLLPVGAEEKDQAGQVSPGEGL